VLLFLLFVLKAESIDGANREDNHNTVYGDDGEASSRQLIYKTVFTM
jgi:hypothetical protein